MNSEIQEKLFKNDPLEMTSDHSSLNLLQVSSTVILLDLAD